MFNNGATGQREGKQEYYIAYAQDEWRMASNVTLNYGMRFEHYTPMREARNLDVQFNINCTTTPDCFLPTNHPFYQSRMNFDPRVGLSFRRIRKLRFAAVSVSSTDRDRRKICLQPIESDLINTVVNGGTYPIDVSAVRASFISNPLNRSFGPRAYDPNYTVPERIYTYNASVQRELPGHIVVTGAYVGSQGTNLFLRSIANRIVAVRTNPDPTRPASSSASSTSTTAGRTFYIRSAKSITRPAAAATTTMLFKCRSSGALPRA